MVIRYSNLTQNTGGTRFIYIRSTDIEQKNWKRLLWSVPDEMLYFLSLGEVIEIVDKSTKKRGKVERIFVPVLGDILRWIYYNDPPIHKNLKYHTNLCKVLLRQDGVLRRRFDYWKGKRYKKEINIIGKTIKVEKEANL